MSAGARLRVPCAAILACLTLLTGAGCASVAPVSSHPPGALAAVPPQPLLGGGTRLLGRLKIPGDGSPRLLQHGVWAEPDAGRRPLAWVLRNAAHSIDMTIYLLTDHTMIHDLEYAHANGAQVRVILEQHPFGQDGAARGANQTAFDQLYAADIPVRWASTRFRLTHEKTVVVDGTVAYILTLNLSRSAFTHNREFGVVDRDPADVREAAAIFNADWSGAVYTPRDPDLIVSPTNSRARLLALLARARRGVDLYAEEVQDAGLEDALLACARRHVRVRLISNAGDASNALGIARLRAGGVTVHLLTAPYIHAKAILADGRWAFVGSENISAASLDANRELGVLIADPDSLARLATVFAQDWAA